MGIRSSYFMKVQHRKWTRQKNRFHGHKVEKIHTSRPLVRDEHGRSGLNKPIHMSINMDTHLLPKFHGLASNTQQFGIRGSPTSKVVNERFENKIIELTSLVRQLAIRQPHNSPLVKEYGMCASIEHSTNVCPILQEIEP
ncbi:hypothetical protein CR513_02184, partial [Mucuna pruriens]